MTENLAAIYRHRFDAIGIERRKRVWKVLCADFFDALRGDRAHADAGLGGDGGVGGGRGGRCGGWVEEAWRDRRGRRRPLAAAW